MNPRTIRLASGLDVDSVFFKSIYQAGFSVRSVSVRTGLVRISSSSWRTKKTHACCYSYKDLVFGERSTDWFRNKIAMIFFPYPF